MTVSGDCILQERKPELLLLINCKLLWMYRFFVGR